MNSFLASVIPVLPSHPSIPQLSENLEMKEYICHQQVARQRNNSDWPGRNKCVCRKSRRHTVGCRKLERKNFAWMWWKDKPQSVQNPQNYIHPVPGKLCEVWIQIICHWEQGKKMKMSFFVHYVGNIIIGFRIPGAHEERKLFQRVYFLLKRRQQKNE